MALPPDIIRAARKYGGLVDALAEQRYHISGPALLAKLVQGESGGSGSAVSGAGARGYSQFMPGSRQIAIQKYGVDPWAGPDQAVHAAALHLLGKINGSKGLEGYNPGSSSYPSYILGQKVGDVGSSGASGGSGGRGGTGSLGVTVTPGTTQNSFDPGPQPATSLAGLLSQPVAPPVAIPVAPTPAIQSPVIEPSAPQGNGLAEALAAIQTGPQSLPETSSTGPSVKVTGHAPTASAASVGSTRVAHFDGKPVASWMVPALQYARQHGWKGTVTSGVRTYAQQAALYAKRGSNPYPVAKPGSSNHEIENGGAVDVSDPSTLARIMQGYQGRKLRQGAAIGDPVHFSATGR